MADKDTGGQRQEQHRHGNATEVTGDEVVEQAAVSDSAERKAQLDADIDSILDEIDEVVETNAEDFVRSFVQKGGQ